MSNRNNPLIITNLLDRRVSIRGRGCESGLFDMGWGRLALRVFDRVHFEGTPSWNGFMCRRVTVPTFLLGNGDLQVANRNLTVLTRINSFHFIANTPGSIGHLINCHGPRITIMIDYFIDSINESETVSSTIIYLIFNIIISPAPIPPQTV
jgi:hypothetical protein